MRAVGVGGMEREGGRACEGPLGKSLGQMTQGWNEAWASAAASHRVASRGVGSSGTYQMWVKMKVSPGFWLGRLGGWMTGI